MKTETTHFPLSSSSGNKYGIMLALCSFRVEMQLSPFQFEGSGSTFIGVSCSVNRPAQVNSKCFEKGGFAKKKNEKPNSFQALAPLFYHLTSARSPYFPRWNSLIFFSIGLHAFTRVSPKIDQKNRLYGNDALKASFKANWQFVIFLLGVHAYNF